MNQQHDKDKSAVSMTEFQEFVHAYASLGKNGGNAFSSSSSGGGAAAAGAARTSRKPTVGDTAGSGLCGLSSAVVARKTGRLDVLGWRSEGWKSRAGGGEWRRGVHFL